MKKILIGTILIILVFTVLFTEVIAIDNNEISNTIEENTNTIDNSISEELPPQENNNENYLNNSNSEIDNGNNSEVIDNNEEENYNNKPTVNYNSYTTTNENNQKPKSKNANLKLLQIDIEGLSPEFNKDVTEYYLVVGLEIEDIKVIARAEDINSDVVVSGNTDLEEGKNKIIITVTAEAGNTKIYVLNVTKTDNEQLINANLKSLMIDGFELYPTFKPNIYNYNVNINKVISFLDVKAEAENEKATIAVEGNNNLTEGDNIIKITVTAEDEETTRTYKINTYISSTNIKVQEENKTPAYVAIVVLIIVILGLSIALIKKKK